MTSTKSSTETTTMTTTTTPSESFGQRLRRLRKNKGLTQEELAFKVEVSVMTIRRWEWGNSTPQIEEVRKLAEALGVPQAELLEASPLPPNRWVLQLKVAHEFKKEVFDLTGNVPCEFSITTTPLGGMVTLSGAWQEWTDDELFKHVMKRLKQARKSVINSGIDMGVVKPNNKSGGKSCGTI